LKAIISLSVILALVLAYLLYQVEENRSLIEMQGEALRADIVRLREELSRTSNEPQRSSVNSPAETAVNQVTVMNGSSQGKDGPFTLVGFIDYQSPYARKFFSNTLPQIRKQYIKTGKLRYVVKDFPQKNHPDARNSAMAARCAGEQKKFWEMHDALLSGMVRLKRKDLLRHAKEIGVDLTSFQKCLDSGKFEIQIEQDIAEAERNSITQVPSFILGKSEGGAVSGILIKGPQPFQSFQRQIENLHTKN